MKKEPHFSRGFFKFLSELAANNNRDWFLENKDRYEKVVREPAMRFVSDVGPHLEKISTHYVADPRPTGGSLMRIYRDIRFSKDKTPYKTNVAMYFRYAAPGSEDAGPGLYLHLSPTDCFAGGGFWHPGPETLKQVRNAIIARPKDWKKVVDKVEVQAGEHLKRPPAGMNVDHPFIEDLKKKDFIASARFTQARVCSADFITEFAKACKSMAPLLKFLGTAKGLPW
ncbi:MAG TPA: TIGR02453 family protein [Blastocatellia bacterium]